VPFDQQIDIIKNIDITLVESGNENIPIQDKQVFDLSNPQISTQVKVPTENISSKKGEIDISLNPAINNKVSLDKLHKIKNNKSTPQDYSTKHKITNQAQNQKINTKVKNQKSADKGINDNPQSSLSNITSELPKIIKEDSKDININAPL